MGEARITIVGHFDPEYRAHTMLRDAVIHAEKALGVVVNTRWVTPNELSDVDVLQGTCAAIIASRNPKAPRQLWPEILGSLRWLRDRRIPTLAIEYGYQHMVIELARSILGRQDANSTAYDDGATFPVIAPLVLDQPPIDKFRPQVIEVELDPESHLAALYGQSGVIRESFRGHYVFNPDYAPEFEQAGFRLSARGRVGECNFIAGIEWNALPFHLGVAYLPQFASSAERCHPVIKGLVKAGLEL